MFSGKDCVELMLFLFQMFGRIQQYNHLNLKIHFLEFNSFKFVEDFLMVQDMCILVYLWTFENNVYSAIAEWSIL